MTNKLSSLSRQSMFQLQHDTFMYLGHLRRHKEADEKKKELTEEEQRLYDLVTDRISLFEKLSENVEAILKALSPLEFYEIGL